MQGMDGIEVYKEIKRINSHIPIIFNTAYPGEYDSMEILQTLHPFSYIIKGSKSRVLIDNVDSAVQYYKISLENITMVEILEATNKRLDKKLDSISNLDILKTFFVVL